VSSTMLVADRDRLVGEVVEPSPVVAGILSSVVFKTPALERNTIHKLGQKYRVGDSSLF